MHQGGQNPRINQIEYYQHASQRYDSSVDRGILKKLRSMH